MTKLKTKQRDHPLKFAGFHNQSPLLTMVEAIRVFLHTMNWEESDDYDFDAELIDASENLPQRESVNKFLEIFRLEDDDFLPIEEVRKKWFVIQTKREKDLKSLRKAKESVKHSIKKMKRQSEE